MGIGKAKTSKLLFAPLRKFQEVDPIVELLNQREMMIDKPEEYLFGDKADELDAVDDLIKQYYADRVTDKSIEEGMIIKRGSREGDLIYLTKSTREGVKYQLTYVDDKGPSGHVDYNSISEILKELVNYGGIILKR